jgi:hypothetical protein
MIHTPSIRSALLGIAGAITALLIGIAPSSATAATHENAQQSHPIAATHATEKQSLPREPAVPCPLHEGLGIGYQVQLFPTAQMPMGASVGNIYDGPDQSCNFVGSVPAGDTVTVYSTLDGYSYVTDSNFDRGWMNNLDIDFGGSGIGTLPQSGFGCVGTCPPTKLCKIGQRECHPLP